MHDKIEHNPLGTMAWTPGHSATSIRPRDYLSTPWVVKLTPGGRYRPLWEPLGYIVSLICSFLLRNTRNLMTYICRG